MPVQLTFKSVLNRNKRFPYRSPLLNVCSLQKAFCELDHWQKANEQYLTWDLNARLPLDNTRSEVSLPLHPKDFLCKAASNEQKAV